MNALDRMLAERNAALLELAALKGQEPVAYQEFTETGEWFLAYGKHPTAKQNPLFLAAGAQPSPQYRSN